MTSLVDRGFAVLNRAMTPAAATTVRYIRGATVISDELPATFSAPQIEQITEGGASVIGRQFTWQLKRGELRWENAPDRPRRNDVIEWVLGGVTYVFEVMPSAGGNEAPAADLRSDWVPASVKLIEQR